ncbi:hypothetical protein VHUM_02598 [Vanrija humicola]|uniref:Phosphatidylinositol N-acetylglucosaminyltransferase subunit H conserved domain-containing protein n=1 Tax=Vanrija humicola TaxID=5417 RepID=A0A7D8Z329_VANHU|nr:hypothetical protein VHUM_02598 [Vanrija humicola]
MRARPLPHCTEYTTHSVRVGADTVTEHRVARRQRAGSGRASALTRAALPLLVALAVLLLAHRAGVGPAKICAAAAGAALLALYAASRSVLYRESAPWADNGACRWRVARGERRSGARGRASTRLACAGPTDARCRCRVSSLTPPESLTPLPGLGIQLATTRGPSPRLARTTRRFIPLSELATVVIHEGLVRFNVRFYLGLVRASDVVVAFDEVHPRLEVLKEVYHAAREQLYDEYADDDESEE